MCGFVGRCARASATVSEAEIRDALCPIRHRGPDGEGVWTGPGVGLGHLRLSILDLSTMAAQLMISHDRRYTLVFNGEIYNYRTLPDTLAAHGVRVTSTGDTEVLLEHISAFGLDATFRALEGGLGGGRLGHPRRGAHAGAGRARRQAAYYAHDANGLRFGSEIKALVVTGRTEPNLPH